MRCTSGVSGAANAQQALEAACQQVLEQLAGAPCTLGCLFVSPLYQTSVSWARPIGRVRSLGD